MKTNIINIKNLGVTSVPFTKKLITTLLNKGGVVPPSTNLVNWVANTAEYYSTEGVSIKDYNGITDTPNMLQYDVEQTMGNVFDTGGTLLIKMSLPIEKMNTNHRYYIAGGPPTTSRCFHMSYYGGLNNNVALRNKLEFNFRGSSGDRVTLQAEYTGGDDIVFCVRKKADQSITMSIIDTLTLSVTEVTDENLGNASIPSILNFTVANCSTVLTTNKSTTLNSAQESRFIGGLHSMFIYPTTLEDSELLDVAQGVPITNYLGFAAQMARQFTTETVNGGDCPLVSGCTDLITTMPAYKLGDPVTPLNSITRSGKETWVLNDPIIDGEVFGASSESGNPVVLINGTCSNNLTAVKARLISPTEVSDWRIINVSGGVISGEIETVVKPDWFVIEISDVEETVNHRTISRVGAGYVIFAPNQSQFRIMSTSDSTSNVATLDAGVKCSMVIDEDGSNYTGKWKNHVYEEGFPIPDGIAGFFNKLHEDLNAPILMLNNAVSGTGVDQWLDDSVTERKWSDTVDCVNHHKGRVINAVLWVWYTNNQTLGYDYPLLFDAVLNNEGAYKSPDDHYLGELFDEGYKFVVMPATRATEGEDPSYDFNNGASMPNIDACRKVQRSWCEGKDFAVVGPETVDMAIYDNGWDGPHENRDIPEGTWRLGYRCAIGVSRGLGFDDSTDPSIGQATINPERTIITFSTNLPNTNSTLKTNGFDTEVTGFEISETGGTVWSRSGFTAQVQGNEVVITKTVGSFLENTLVRYCYGGPMSYGATAEQNAVYNKVLCDGTYYESGLGIPLTPMDTITI